MLKGGAIFGQGRLEAVVTVAALQSVFGVEMMIIPDPVSCTPFCIPLHGQTRLPE